MRRKIRTKEENEALDSIKSFLHLDQWNKSKYPKNQIFINLDNGEQYNLIDVMLHDSDTTDLKSFKVLIYALQYARFSNDQDSIELFYNEVPANYITLEELQKTKTDL
tara:strand:+ start:3250 stop:3573 length:324 start_codon:yes stop_codon:yes gene_type:complete